MAWSDYLGALSPRQRLGLVSAAIVIVAVMGYAGYLLLDDPYVPLESHLTSDRLADITQQLDRSKMSYRVSPSAETVLVPQSQIGKARAALAAGPSATPAGVGLELFKETDFSSTDFTQRINYQRALQGELSRTIQAMAGVRSVRVHVILADSGVFKRDAAKASAAVSLAMQPGKSLTRSQVRGIQRLVAASVPEIKVDDVVILDESGTSLSKPASEFDDDPSSVQLDMRRQVNQYLESKAQRLLQDLVPQGIVSVAVDTDLDDRHLRVTTDEPLVAPGQKDVDRPAGVLVKERQAQRGRSATTSGSASEPTDPESADWENEYKVGHRVEQVLSAPGTVKRISVAVVLQGAAASVSNADVEALVGHAIGVDRTRGDSVDVLMMASAPSGAAPTFLTPATGTQRAADDAVSTPRGVTPSPWTMVVFGLATLILSFGVFVARQWRIRLRARQPGIEAGPDIEVTLATIRRWLAEGQGHARG